MSTEILHTFQEALRTGLQQLQIDLMEVRSRIGRMETEIARKVLHYVMPRLTEKKFFRVYYREQASRDSSSKNGRSCWIKYGKTYKDQFQYYRCLTLQKTILAWTLWKFVKRHFNNLYIRRTKRLSVSAINSVKDYKRWIVKSSGSNKNLKKIGQSPRKPRQPPMNFTMASRSEISPKFWRSSSSSSMKKHSLKTLASWWGTLQTTLKNPWRP